MFRRLIIVPHLILLRAVQLVSTAHGTALAAGLVRVDLAVREVLLCAGVGGAVLFFVAVFYEEGRVSG